MNHFLPVAVLLGMPALADNREAFGAVLAPSSLPPGASALYAFVGAPELGGGYRQGLSLLEVEARASFDYLQLAIAAEGLVKDTMLRRGAMELSPSFGVGVVYDTGSRYFDTANFQYLGVRARAGLLASFRVAETVRALASLDVPLDVTVQPTGGIRFRPLLGGGVEVFLGREVSGLVLGQLGLDLVKEPPLGVPQLRAGWQLRLGLGWRLF